LNKILLTVLVIVVCITSPLHASTQLYADYLTQSEWSLLTPSQKAVYDQDADSFPGHPDFVATPHFELPVDFNDINQLIHPGAFDNTGVPNGLDDDQDGVIDGAYTSGLAFAALSDLTINPGDSISRTLGITGANSPEAAHIQAFPSGTTFNAASRQVSWTSEVTDAGQSFLFSFDAVAGGTIIQRQFTVQVVPEPAAALFLGGGWMALVAFRRTPTRHRPA
jgi:hypothetical protein